MARHTKLIVTLRNFVNAPKSEYSRDSKPCSPTKHPKTSFVRFTHSHSTARKWLSAFSVGGHLTAANVHLLLVTLTRCEKAQTFSDFRGWAHSARKRPTKPTTWSYASAWRVIPSATEYAHVPSRSSSFGRNMPY